MTRLRRTLTVLLAAAAVATATLAPTAPAWALSLDQAKAEGYLGERADGLLGAVGSQVPAEAAALMRDINAQRLAKYRDIAKQNGTSVQAVQSIAGQKLIAKTPGGQYVNTGGGWTRK
jgi:uncharacterized protein YdbL (DUF1318 family)